VAKISKVNIAITGDSKGLTAATDAASKELRRLEANAARTTKQVGAMRSNVNQSAEALAKLGAQSKALQGVGGVLGLAQLGGAGIALGAAGLGLAAAGTGVAAIMQAIQEMPNLQKRAVQALEAVQLDQRRRIEEFGLSQLLAQNIAQQAPSTPSAAPTLGIGGGFGAGFAGSGGGFATGANLFRNYRLPALATYLGTLAGGGGFQRAQAQAESTVDPVMRAVMAAQPVAGNNPLEYVIRELLGF
jgi:hypothetical protein